MFTLKLELKTDSISNVINDNIEKNIKGLIVKLVQETLKTEFNKIVKDSYWNKEDKDKLSSNVQDIIRKVIIDKVNEKYPDIVENKINEFKQYIINMKISDNNNREPNYRSIQQAAMERVNKYIETEMMDSVKKTKQEIDDFAKQYFTQNLFRAMGIFGKTMEQIEK